MIRPFCSLSLKSTKTDLLQKVQGIHIISSIGWPLAKVRTVACFIQLITVDFFLEERFSKLSPKYKLSIQNQ
jgi:hypothetical protein